LTIVLILVSVLASLTSQFGQERGQVLYRLAITGFTTVPTDFGGEFMVWEQNLDRIRQGEVWRLLTPIFLHFSILHLAFNMFWLYDLGGRIESYRGAWKLALLVLLAGIPANLGQYAASGPYFGGMSGVVYALFGYVWMKSRFDPGPGMYVHFHIVAMMIVWLFLGLTGLLGPIGNTAHFVGLVVGVVLGYAPVAWRRLRRR
jgi:GlpG protein